MNSVDHLDNYKLSSHSRNFIGMQLVIGYIQGNSKLVDVSPAILFKLVRLIRSQKKKIKKKIKSLAVSIPN